MTDAKPSSIDKDLLDSKETIQSPNQTEKIPEKQVKPDEQGKEQKTKVPLKQEPVIFKMPKYIKAFNILTSISVISQAITYFFYLNTTFPDKKWSFTKFQQYFITFMLTLLECLVFFGFLLKGQCKKKYQNQIVINRSMATMSLCQLLFCFILGPNQFFGNSTVDLSLSIEIIISWCLISVCVILHITGVCMNWQLDDYFEKTGMHDKVGFRVELI